MTAFAGESRGLRGDAVGGGEGVGASIVRIDFGYRLLLLDRLISCF
ncbi:MAG: hypothetical protein M3R06_03460 [Chloroflexota bacterium]|nr:hypothetical protein [Chloroflexota bacterium]